MKIPVSGASQIIWLTHSSTESSGSTVTLPFTEKLLKLRQLEGPPPSNQALSQLYKYDQEGQLICIVQDGVRPGTYPYASTYLYDEENQLIYQTQGTLNRQKEAALAEGKGTCGWTVSIHIGERNPSQSTVLRNGRTKTVNHYPITYLAERLIAPIEKRFYPGTKTELDTQRIRYQHFKTRNDESSTSLSPLEEYAQTTHIDNTSGNFSIDSVVAKPGEILGAVYRYKSGKINFFASEAASGNEPVVIVAHGAQFKGAGTFKLPEGIEFVFYGKIGKELTVSVAKTIRLYPDFYVSVKCEEGKVIVKKGALAEQHEITYESLFGGAEPGYIPRMILQKRSASYHTRLYTDTVDRRMITTTEIPALIGGRDRDDLRTLASLALDGLIIATPRRHVSHCKEPYFLENMIDQITELNKEVSRIDLFICTNEIDGIPEDERINHLPENEPAKFLEKSDFSPCLFRLPSPISEQMKEEQFHSVEFSPQKLA